MYHGYRITFTGYDQDGAAVFLISKRHSGEILAKTPSVSSAIDLINTWEKQLSIPLTTEDWYAKKDIGRITEPAAGAEALKRMAHDPVPE